jgi:sulfur relay protein TusB/DsrH
MATASSDTERMKVLHIIRSSDDPLAKRVIADISGAAGAEQTLLLMQDGVYTNPQGAANVFACSDDVAARGVTTDIPLVEYDRIVEMIFENDKVITW